MPVPCYLPIAADADDLAVGHDRRAAFERPGAAPSNIGLGRRSRDYRAAQRDGKPPDQSHSGVQCFKLGSSGNGTTRMPAASSPSRTARDTVTAVGPSPCTQIESTWQGMRLPEVE